MISHLKSPAGVCKLVSLGLGLIVLGVGLHSHYQSSWVKRQDILRIKAIPLYIICDIRRGLSPELSPEFLQEACPSISLERCFVAVIILSFIVLVALLVAGFYFDLESHPLKWIDVGGHAGAALLLLISAILYIVSASEIDSLLSDDNQVVLKIDLVNLNLRKSEKLAAASLAIIQSLNCVLVSLFIFKDNAVRIQHR